MNKEVLRKRAVILFIVVGILLAFYEANKPGPMIIEGLSDGYAGDLTVNLHVKKKGENYKIVGVDITHVDTPAIADPAIEILKSEIIRKQGKNIDMVAGATYTSEGVQEAVENALLKLK